MQDATQSLTSEPTSQDLVECPACNGMGYGFAGATVGMWAGLVPWNDALRPEACALCDGEGRVPARVAEEYETLIWEG